MWSRKLQNFIGGARSISIFYHTPTLPPCHHHRKIEEAQSKRTRGFPNRNAEQKISRIRKPPNIQPNRIALPPDAIPPKPLLTPSEKYIALFWQLTSSLWAINIGIIWWKTGVDPSRITLPTEHTYKALWMCVSECTTLPCRII